MSSVPSPRVRKPKPRERLNHLTMTISKLPICVGLRAQPRLQVGDAAAGSPGVTECTFSTCKPAVAALRLGDDAGAFAQAS